MGLTCSPHQPPNPPKKNLPCFNPPNPPNGGLSILSINYSNSQNSLLSTPHHDSYRDPQLGGLMLPKLVRQVPQIGGFRGLLVGKTSPPIGGFRGLTLWGILVVDGFYSYLSASTGFLDAALQLCHPTVKIAIIKTNIPASTKIHQLKCRFVCETL